MGLWPNQEERVFLKHPSGADKGEVLKGILETMWQSRVAGVFQAGVSGGRKQSQRGGRNVMQQGEGREPEAWIMHAELSGPNLEYSTH